MMKGCLLMKKLNKIISGALMVGVLMSTGVTALAATDTPEPSRVESMKRCNRNFDGSERPELTDEEKAQMADKMKDRLSEQLEAGRITQEQYDQAIADIAAGKKPMGLAKHKGKGKGKDCSADAERPERPELTDEQKARMADKKKDRLRPEKLDQ